MRGAFFPPDGGPESPARSVPPSFAGRGPSPAALRAASAREGLFPRAARFRSDRALFRTPPGGAASPPRRTRAGPMTVGVRLLGWLRRETGDPSLAFREGPRRLAGGTDTGTFRFALERSPPGWGRRPRAARVPGGARPGARGARGVRPEHPARSRGSDGARAPRRRRPRGRRALVRHGSPRRRTPGPSSAGPDTRPSSRPGTPRSTTGRSLRSASRWSGGDSKP